MGWWQNTVKSLGASDSEHEADILRAHTQKCGHSAIAMCCVGQAVTVEGVVRSVMVEPRCNSKRFEAVLYDGTGSVQLVWLGRRVIPGIEPGRQLKVTGRLTSEAGKPMIYNPRYEIAASATL